MSLFSRKPKGPFLRVSSLTMHWDVEDPFVFASHHEDDYPAGNRQMAPPLQEISGRNLGRDYKKIMGFRMFNGKVVPGFPMHAHWGYETVTLPQIGYVDHSDCEGNTGRYGFGDVQWVSAPGFYEHCEMYPLVDQENRNPNDITQIMIACPPESRGLPESSVNTVWREDVPVVEKDGCRTQVICGRFSGKEARSPSRHTWADGSRWVRILRMEMEPGARTTIDPADPAAGRNLYFVTGDKATVMGETLDWSTRVRISPTENVEIANGDAPAVMWLLEGVPVGGKQSMFGPVLLGSDREVRDALQTIRKEEYQRWPWDVIDRVNPVDSGRFLLRSDGTRESPEDLDT